MRRLWHPFVAEIQLLKTKLFKETKSADSLRLYGDFVKIVEFWQWMVFCEHGSRKYQNTFNFAAFTLLEEI